MPHFAEYFLPIYRLVTLGVRPIRYASSCTDVISHAAARHPEHRFSAAADVDAPTLGGFRSGNVVHVRRVLLWSLLISAGLAPASALGRGSQAATPAQQADERIRALQAEADRLAAQSGTLLGELRKLELDRAIKTEAARKADAAVTAVTVELSGVERRVADLEAQRVASSADVRQRLVAIYKQGRSGYLRLLFGADDLRALGRLTRAAAAIASLDRLRIEEHRRTLAAERQAIADLRARRQSLASAQSEARTARAALDAAIAVQNQRIDQVDTRRDLTAQYIGELQAATSELDRRVAGMESAVARPLPLQPFRGALEWPAGGRVVSAFGRDTNRAGVALDRNGIEIGVQEGADARAVHAGTVTFAAPFAGFGTLVIVDHGNNDYTLYGHLDRALVSEGARVEAGSVVGRTGRNPEGTEVLYFEIRVDGRPVNPVQWLKPARP